MEVRDLLALLSLGALWGGSYIFIRVAVPDLGPFVLMEVRTALAVLILTLYAAAMGRLPKFKGRRKRFLVLGGLNAAVPFTLIAAAEIHLPASLAAILNSTTVLFVAMVAAVWLGEALTARKMAGLALGMAGVAALVGWTPVVLDGALLLSVGAMLAASFSYAVGGVYAKRNFAGAPLELAIGQLSGAAILLLPLAAATLPREAPSSGAVLAVLGLTVLSTAVAYLIYFYLLTHVGPTRTLTVTFLIPVFGLFLGVLFLAEPVGVGTVAGMLAILVSVGLVTGIRFGKGRD